MLPDEAQGPWVRSSSTLTCPALTLPRPLRGLLVPALLPREEQVVEDTGVLVGDTHQAASASDLGFCFWPFTGASIMNIVRPSMRGCMST